MPPFGKCRLLIKPHALGIALGLMLLSGCGGSNTNPALSSLALANHAPSSPLHTPKRFHDIHAFCRAYPSCSDGAQPSGSVVLDANGAIYGTLAIGGAGASCKQEDGCGAIYKLTRSGKTYAETLLYAFCQEAGCTDGSDPSGALVFDNNGAIFGTTNAGGTENGGVVFELMPFGSTYRQRVLYTFCKAPNCADGRSPQAGVIIDSKGTLYGTTAGGGRYGSGTIFRLIQRGSTYAETVLHSFCKRGSCTDGARPVAGLIMDKAGALYGTAPGGGDRNGGVAFKFTRSGAHYTEQVLYSFCRSKNCADGTEPMSAMIFDAHGALYGTTVAGGIRNCYRGAAGIYSGSNGCGTVFELARAGTGYSERVLHRFCHKVVVCVDGAYPNGVVFDSHGALYGTTTLGGRGPDQQGQAGGLIFELIPSGSDYRYQVLHNFKSFSDLRPATTAILKNNVLYGNSMGGTPIRGPVYGSVWELPRLY